MIPLPEIVRLTGIPAATLRGRFIRETALGAVKADYQGRETWHLPEERLPLLTPRYRGQRGPDRWRQAADSGGLKK
jgi:surfactin synthase thioesterase subunit